MAQIGNVHPDDLVPAWHSSRHLTPAETETVGSLLREHLEDWVAERQLMEIDAWLEGLPPIPARRADRPKWALALTGRDGGDYYALASTRQHLAAIRRAIRSHDYRSALLLMTYPRRTDAKVDKSAEFRPAWERQLQAIREALDERIDDALEAAVAAKSAEALAD